MDSEKLLKRLKQDFDLCEKYTSLEITLKGIGEIVTIRGHTADGGQVIGDLTVAGQHITNTEFFDKYKDFLGLPEYTIRAVITLGYKRLVEI